MYLPFFSFNNKGRELYVDTRHLLLVWWKFRL